jgi:hypothetical protein
MKYRSVLRRLLVLAALLVYLSPGLTLPRAQAAPHLVATYDFESTLNPWSAAADANTISGLAQSARNNACPGNGTASAEITISNTLTSPAGAWMGSTFPALSPARWS